MLTDALLPFVPAVTVLTTVVSVVGWVALDAASRGANPRRWAVFALMTFPVFLLTVAVLRTRHDRVREPGRRYVACRTVAVGSLVAFLVAGSVGPPDPYTHLFYWLGAFPVALVIVVAVDRYWLGGDDRVTF